MMAKRFAAVTGRTVDVGASTYVDAVAVKDKQSDCCFLTSWRIHSFVPFLYEPDGEKLADKLWEETMEELTFVNPKAILSGMGTKRGWSCMLAPRFAGAPL